MLKTLYLTYDTFYVHAGLPFGKNRYLSVSTFASEAIQQTITLTLPSNEQVKIAPVKDDEGYVTGTYDVFIRKKGYAWIPRVYNEIALSVFNQIEFLYFTRPYLMLIRSFERDEHVFWLYPTNRATMFKTYDAKYPYMSIGRAEPSFLCKVSLYDTLELRQSFTIGCLTVKPAHGLRAFCAYLTETDTERDIKTTRCVHVRDLEPTFSLVKGFDFAY